MKIEKLPPPSHLTSGGTGSVITALLGPTNTGKTHRAIERMIEHGAGMIGLPLRLLAREVYDRLTARVGVTEVALLTGEERITPTGARFLVCTVESMPVTRAVPFVAVDEIQLAGHPERGHVFTDRLLNARGTRETWFMGSDTMRPLIERLVPTAKIVTFERLSALRYTEPRRLSALPPRSAVIAFSVSSVYALAEQLRTLRGGVAIVLGALSPTARNAQVAMFEQKEVQHLVSTDAIGMGLNLDIRTIFFGETRKYDGRDFRPLESAEMGQIAGRAGRHTRDGHFSLTRACAQRHNLHPSVIASIESQRFPAQRRIYYRNSDLETDSIDALKHSLRRSPFSRALMSSGGLPDEVALDMLLRVPEVARTMGRPSNVALLWEVCRIPDYRQDSPLSRTNLLGQIYGQIERDGRVGEPWMKRNLGRLSSVDANTSIDALMQRIAHVRTFAFIAHRADWLARPDHWRAEVLALEELLSASLHERLTSHFVDERAGIYIDRPRPHGVELASNIVQTRTIPLGHMRHLSFVPDQEASQIFGQKVTRREGRRACLEAAKAQTQALLDAPAEAWAFTPSLRVAVADTVVARLKRGPRLTRPLLGLQPLNLLEEPERHEIRQRADAWLRDTITAWLDAHKVEEGTALAGALYVVRSNLGVIRRAEVRKQLDALKPDDRKSLAEMNIRTGLKYIYAEDAFTPQALHLRAALWTAWLGCALPDDLPDDVAPSLTWPRALSEAMGYVELGPRHVRIDALERLTAKLRKSISYQAHAPLPEAPLRWLDCTPKELAGIATALGYRALEGGVWAPPKRKKKRYKTRTRR